VFVSGVRSQGHAILIGFNCPGFLPEKRFRVQSLKCRFKQIKDIMLDNAKKATTELICQHYQLFILFMFLDVQWKAYTLSLNFLKSLIPNFEIVNSEDKHHLTMFMLLAFI
jgi:hypothetical protein